MALKFVVCVMVLVLTLSFCGFVSRFSVVHAWVGTVYIRGNGSVEPFGAPINTTDGVVYRLWNNISVSSLMASGIVIERDNIILDGNGFFVQGSKSSLTIGVNLKQRNNVTVMNLNVQGHAIGINVYQSLNIKIQACNIIDNTWGIDLTYSNSSIVQENNLVDNGHAIRLGASSTYNTVSSNNVTGGGNGIIIQDNFNVVSANYLNGSFSETATGIGIGASENKILWNTVTAYGVDISLSASKNLIYGNNITLSGIGVGLSENANNNTIAGNTIAASGYGIYIYMASNNRIYHNTFYENGLDIFVENGAVNYFDGGYPSGGNYWEGYSGADSNHGPGQNIAGSDGIIDTPYSPSTGIIDNYPLAAPFVAIRAGTWNGLTFSFEVISNSTISDLLFNPQIGPFLKFNVSGMYETTGFCRITIPKKVLWTENSWNITVNGQKIENYLELIDEENTYLYFTYNHSTKTVTIQGTHIIPELQPSILPLLFMALSILAIIFANKTQKKAKPPKTSF